MPGFLSPGKGVPLLLIPEYSGINKRQRVPDRSKTAPRKPFVKCFLTIVQAIILEGVAISSSRESSWPRNQIHFPGVLCIGRWMLYHWAILEALCGQLFIGPPGNSLMASEVKMFTVKMCMTNIVDMVSSWPGLVNIISHY